MEHFDVYSRYDVTPERAEDVYVFDDQGRRYLDFYGGHGVISIGHSHPRYVQRVSEQIGKIGFYSNSVRIPQQEELAHLLGEQSGYPEYQLFLCNSGAEATENALKLASFHTGRKEVIAFRRSFHGRTAAALNITDNPKISAPINQQNYPVHLLPLNDEAAFLAAIASDKIAAVIVEGIQGVGGLDMPDTGFLKLLREACTQHKTILILDEIQSGYGRSGAFFAHQHAEIRPDLITLAKGMGNGFPVAGVLIHPEIKAQKEMLGTTFGGNHLACAAALAVLETIRDQDLIHHAEQMGVYLAGQLKDIPRVVRVKGRGLMLGAEFDFPVKDLRAELLFTHGIFTGSASNPNLIRILPPLTITKEHADVFIEALKTATA